MTARYAIYYAPAAEDELYRAASAWLGRDVYTDTPLVRPAIASMESLDLDALTSDPRHYGWHATLKAPFELAAGQATESLLAEVAAYCGQRSPFSATLEVAALGDFLAFTLAEPSADMRLLHEDCVRRFDHFRAPLSDFDLARRRRARMSAEQDARLIAFGYPWIFEDFRFHMTLTGRIRDEAERTRVLAALQQHFAAYEGPHVFGGLALFFQPDRDSDFIVLDRYAFGG
jgi:putative phosphonate metabolism protein